MLKADMQKKEVGQRIQKCRKAQGMTRKDLASKLGDDNTDRLEDWEQGKTLPRVLDFITLAEALNTTSSELLGDAKDMGNNKEDEVLEFLSIIDENKSKAMVYHGVEEILCGWNSYWDAYNQIVDMSYRINGDPDSDWTRDNSFRILINSEDGSVVAIRDFGKYYPEVEDFLFKTKYIPMFTHQPMKKDEFERHIKLILDTFNSEITYMKSVAKKPLFLIRDAGANNYLAWSLNENINIAVFDYKEYREDFRIAKLNGYSSVRLKDNKGEYKIIPPSDELISLLRLDLISEKWKRKHYFDKWEPQEPKSSMPIDNPIYLEGIRIINEGRKHDFGLDEELDRLESRVERFERVYKLNAPEFLLESEIKLIGRSINEIKICNQEI